MNNLFLRRLVLMELGLNAGGDIMCFFFPFLTSTKNVLCKSICINLTNLDQGIPTDWLQFGG